MVKLKNKTTYRGFGLKITSDFSLPEMPESMKTNNPEDLQMKRCERPNALFDLKMAPYEFIVKHNQVVFYVPEVAFFSIEEGKSITVAPFQQADEDLLRLYLLGTCMGAALMQRRILPLHGSAIAIDGRAYAIVGESGAGKSTLARAFLKKGYQLISDDIIAVSVGTNGIPEVIPAYPQQKLWEDSCDEFGVETSHFRPIYERETKFSIPVPSAFCNERLPLAGIFELTKTANEGAEISPIEKLQGLSTLFSHTYRHFLIPRMGLTDWHFFNSAKILEHAAAYQLRRPHSGFSAYELASLLLHCARRE